MYLQCEHYDMERRVCTTLMTRRVTRHDAWTYLYFERRRLRRTRLLTWRHVAALRILFIRAGVACLSGRATHGAYFARHLPHHLFYRITTFTPAPSAERLYRLPPAPACNILPRMTALFLPLSRNTCSVRQWTRRYATSSATHLRGNTFWYQIGKEQSGLTFG